MLKTGLVFAIIVLFVGTSIVSAFNVSNEPKPSNRSDILYVGGSGPGNYTTIQGAINDASNGDTIFVYDDSSPYYEHLVVDKSINLIGEEMSTTIIDGNNMGTVICISADGAYISGFTIQNSGETANPAGIFIHVSNFCTISSCTILNNFIGVYLDSSAENTITKCSLLSNYYGIRLWDLYTNETDRSDDNRILFNLIQYNVEGISFDHGNWANWCNIIWGNDISYNNQGMSMILSDGNDVAYNDFLNNELTGLGIGMCQCGGDGNILHHNNFINGGQTQAEDGGGGWNDWNYNHWSDYSGVDENQDGYGDIPYTIPGDSNAQDHYPLMLPAGWGNQPPNNPLISGSNEQEVGMPAAYHFRSVDPNGDEMFYFIDWGDRANSGLIGPVSSNYQLTLSHAWSNPGIYFLNAQAIDCWGDSKWSTLVVDVSTITPPVITGPAKGNVNTIYFYNFTSTDPKNHSIFYFIDWGDGSNSSWRGPYDSGDQMQIAHIWQKKGNYQIKAKAKDPYGESDWSILSVTMPRTISFNSLFLKLLERFPHAFPILRHLLKL